MIADNLISSGVDFLELLLQTPIITIIWQLYVPYMKPLLLLISLVLAFIFILNAANTYSIIAHTPAFSPGSNATVAFDPELSQISGFEKIQDRMTAMLLAFRQDARNFQIWSVVFNLITTVAAGLTSLITAISTIRHNALSKRAAISIAIITFTTSLLSFGQSQLQAEQEAVNVKTEAVRTIRDELEALKPDEMKKLLQHYNRQLDEI